MKKSNILVWSVILLVLGFGYWLLSTGKLDFLAGSLIDEIWHSIENMLRPVFRR
jgi:hypothetical protein